MHTLSSDHTLRTRKFDISDPEVLPNLVQQLPDTSGMPEIEYQYDVKPAKNKRREKIHCAHCHGRRHWKGYVVVWPDGCRCLIGKDCGKRHYGIDFQLVETEFGEKRSRKIYLLRYDALMSNLPKLLPVIEELSRRGALFEIDRVRFEISKYGRDIFPVLAAVGDDGTLRVEERVRDIRAEERRSGPEPEFDASGKEVRRGDQIDQEPIFKSVTRHIGIMKGSKLFWNRSEGELNHKFRHRCAALKQAFDELRRIETESISTRRLKALLEEPLRIIEDAADYGDVAAAAVEFFSPGNLRIVADYLNGTIEAQGRVLVKGRRLVFRPAFSDREHVFGLPAQYRVDPGFAALRDFRKVLNGT